MHWLEKRLSRRELEGNVRQLEVRSNLIDFASNDYLGLARCVKLRAAMQYEMQKHGSGNGSTGSRLLTGNTEYAENLESSIASFHGYEAGLLFNCGYMANLGLLSAVCGEEDLIFADSAIHASVRDGIRLSKATSFSFRHNDLDHLEKRLKAAKGKNKFICVESIYSTDGSKAPLKELCEISQKYEANLIVDEAHAVGVFGPSGKGCLAELGLQSKVFAAVVTFGKALGTYGAIVLGNRSLKHYLVNFSTAYIYTTAAPLQVLCAIKCSYDFFPKMDKERKHLYSLMRQVFSNTQIKPISILGNEQVKNASAFLRGKNLDVRALTSPTVQKRKEMLRVCLHAFNTVEEVNMLTYFLE